MSFFRKLFGLGPKVNCHELLANGAVLVDVRTPQEFKEGNVKGSKNIPLDTIPSKIKKFEQLNKPIVLVCRSGMRSGRATAILKSKNIPNVHNGGSWLNFAEL